MANLGTTYDATGGETMGDRDVLPAGEYLAAMVDSPKKDAKAGNGNAYIACEFEVMDGEHKGRRFWTNLNLWNGNQQAVDIAQRELNSIMHACGKLRVSDTAELHGIPMIVRLAVEEGKNGYGPQNRVKAYKPSGGGAPAHSGVQQQPASGGAAPWRRTA